MNTVEIVLAAVALMILMIVLYGSIEWYLYQRKKKRNKDTWFKFL